MLKLRKKLLVLGFIVLSVSACSTDFVNLSPSNAYTNKRIAQKHNIKRGRKKYNSTKEVHFNNEVATKKAKDIMADLRGVASENVYAKLEKTQAVNPIKGYNSVNKGKLKKMRTIAPKKATRIKAIKHLKDQIIGLSEQEVSKLLQKPYKKVKKNHITIWRYKNEICAPKIYFSNGYGVYVDTTNFKDSEACLKSFSL